MSEAAVDRLADYFERLSPEAVERIGEYYAPAAEFKDPFNQVRGVEAIARVFRHMYVQVQAPRFRVVSRMVRGDEAWLAWEFHFRFRGWHASRAQCIRGATHLRFQEDGRVVMHRDYWDSGEELFAKLPLVGRVVNFLRARLAAG